MIALLALLWAAQSSVEQPALDPRIEWVELQRAGQFELALDRVEQHLRSATADRRPGAHYLRGRLLDALDRRAEAATQFAAALTAEPDLEPWARLRLADTQIADGHPEVAAGLLANLLAAGPAEELATQAARRLAATLRAGGDCRLLTHLDSWRLSASDRRPLELERAECARPQDNAAADRALAALLAADTGDGVALEAAERLSVSAAAPSPAVALDMARAFFAQRDFERALEFFSRALAPGALPVATRNDYDTQYAVARSYFWLADYPQASARFLALAESAQPAEAAGAYYQQARSLELAGDRAAAAAAYDRSRSAEPAGSWAPAALSARLRLLWLEGREGEALELYRELGDRRQWRDSRARAALFLAASDLVRGRAERAGAWLATASATSETHEPEVAYWQGRLAEASADAATAVDHYRRSLLADPWDPWALEARARLGQGALAAATERAVEGLASSGRERDLLAAWLLAPQSAAGRASRQALEERWPAGSTERDFLDLAPASIATWPLWRAPLASAEERLLAVGDWQFGAAVASRHFPSSEPPLALARALALAEAGLTRPSILTAEILAHRAPAALSAPLWPAALTRSLYPLARASLIARHARAVDIDPWLLAALIREESRFDAEATSAAAARGLTQFVLPTARRLGRTLGLDDVTAADLYRPEIAVQLGAVYLAELRAGFDDQPHHMLAAYNAGEDQARLWQSYCLSGERAEYLTKVGFRETRGYLRKVLASYARYRELYPGFGAVEVSATTPGISDSTSSK